MNWKRGGVVATAVLLVAACSSPDPQIPSSGQSKVAASPDVSKVTIEGGDPSAPVNKLAMQAIADLEQYWGGEQFPALYDKEFEPIAGGYHAVTEDSPAPPCTTSPDEVAGNAFYCSTEDVVAWDAQLLLPDLQERFGDFAIPVVMAHEWAMPCRPGRTSPRAPSPANCRPTASQARGRGTPRTTGSST